MYSTYLIFSLCIGWKGRLQVKASDSTILHVLLNQLSSCRHLFCFIFILCNRNLTTNCIPQYSSAAKATHSCVNQGEPVLVCVLGMLDDWYVLCMFLDIQNVSLYRLVYCLLKFLPMRGCVPQWNIILQETLMPMLLWCVVMQEVSLSTHSSISERELFMSCMWVNSPFSFNI